MQGVALPVSDEVTMNLDDVKDVDRISDSEREASDLHLLVN